jgi:hypothetical protein
MHSESHPLKDKIVLLNSTTEDPLRGLVVEGAAFEILDWWDLLTGKSWMDSNGNPACLQYAARSGLSPANIPTDDEVVYGKIRTKDGIGLGHLVHVTELGEEI